METVPRWFESPESRKVTERTFEQLMADFALPEHALRGRRVLNIGAGFDDFVSKANRLYGPTGTRAVALDPIYHLLPEKYDTFVAAATEAKLVPEFGYGRFREQDESLSGEARDAAAAEFYKRVRAEIMSDPFYAAGTHQALPFRKASFDLLLANNSILIFDAQAIKETALREGLEVMRDSAEFRLSPFQHLFSPSPDRILLRDLPTLRALQNLEGETARFYSFTIEGPFGERHNRYDDLIMRKDDAVPLLAGPPQKKVILRRLYFERAKDGEIPSEVVSEL